MKKKSNKKFPKSITFTSKSEYQYLQVQSNEVDLNVSDLSNKSLSTSQQMIRSSQQMIQDVRIQIKKSQLLLK